MAKEMAGEQRHGTMRLAIADALGDERVRHNFDCFMETLSRHRAFAFVFAIAVCVGQLAGQERIFLIGHFKRLVDALLDRFLVESRRVRHERLQEASCPRRSVEVRWLAVEKGVDVTTKNSGGEPAEQPVIPLGKFG